MKIGIIGGGSWGTTLAQALTDNNNLVLINDVNSDFVKKINETHLHPFFDKPIPESIKATTNLEEVADWSDYLVLCVPTKFMRGVLKNLYMVSKNKKTLINVSKGIEPSTSLLVSQIVEQEMKEKVESYVVLSGPSHAEEMIDRKFTCLVSASKNPEAAKKVQLIFSNDKYVRVYTSDDVVGVETGGAIKNAIAVVSGIATGLGLGENARAALITRGIRETIKVVEILGGKTETAYGLSGIGDLIVTASSMNSRNFQAGLRIGKGEDYKHVLETSAQTVEGIRTIEAAHEIGKRYNTELPLIDLAYSVLFEGVDINNALKILLNRDLKDENI